MKDRGIRKDDFEHTYVDVSHLFELGDHKAFATVFPKMRGIFGIEVQPDKDFGLEVFEKSMLITGIAREDHFHSDETEENAVRKRSDHPCRLPIDEKRIAEIRAIINPKREDAFVVVVGPEKRAMHAMKKTLERLKMALDGVPRETRKLLPTGNTEFLRVIHGKERIYPDTDTPPVVISSELVDDCRKKVGKRPWEILEELHGKHHLDQNQVDLLIREEKVEKFCDYTQRLGLKGSLAYYLLIELPRSSRRKGTKTSDRIIDELASHLSEELMTYSQIDPLIKILGREPKLSIEEALQKLPPVAVDEATLDRIVSEKLTHEDPSRIVSDEAYRNHMVPKIVGEVLKSVNHSAEGRRVFERVQSLLHQRMNEDGGRKQR